MRATARLPSIAPADESSLNRVPDLATRVTDNCCCMSRRIARADLPGHSPSRGRCFVYVFPCEYEDILKLGFSRDPIARLQALHRRYFEFFDLDRGFLIETETVRDARRLETALAADIAAHSAPAPLVIRRDAAGHTEWYRGAYEPLETKAASLSRSGFTLHRPIRPWVRLNLVTRGGELFEWSNQMLLSIEAQAKDDELMDAMRHALRDALDAYSALEIDLAPLVPRAVLEWYRDNPDPSR
jgi:hypothetical protein